MAVEYPTVGPTTTEKTRTAKAEVRATCPPNGEENQVDEDREIADVRAEEPSRGRRQPKRLMTSERKRRIERAAQMLAESNCSREEFLETIRELGYREGSKEFDDCLKAWNSRRRIP